MWFLAKRRKKHCHWTAPDILCFRKNDRKLVSQRIVGISGYFIINYKNTAFVTWEQFFLVWGITICAIIILLSYNNQYNSLMVLIIFVNFWYQLLRNRMFWMIIEGEMEQKKFFTHYTVYQYWLSSCNEGIKDFSL